MTKPMSPAESFFMRYNIVIITVVAALGLAAIIFISYQSYLNATTVDETITDASVPTTFDKETADRLMTLEPSTNIPEPVLPEGRINPFVE